MTTEDQQEARQFGPPDPGLFEPLTISENSILRAHLTSGWYKQSAVYGYGSSTHVEFYELLGDMHAAWDAVFHAKPVPDVTQPAGPPQGTELRPGDLVNCDACHLTALRRELDPVMFATPAGGQGTRWFCRDLAACTDRASKSEQAEPACGVCRSAIGPLRRLEHEPGFVCENTGACGRRKQAAARIAGAAL
jgi:hypothetical protein